ncbi:cytochrome b/b6 domain-containing protein [Sphingomonas swuensis]|uniref:Cytochrome b/b6 domain-containing protein n=1 Tax=Sphingomonas swuensis TaxID=977800 RepID=A0ABP7SD42_9SPHN
MIDRHRLSTRLWHWLSALAVIVLLMSGLMISNAHPRLYWGEYGANFDAPWLELPNFPGWITIPSTYDLAGARRWHLFFAWVFGLSLFLYLLWSLVNGHLRRDVVPGARELAPSHLWQDIKDHARLRFPTGEAAARYNILQKLSYGGVLLVLLPLLLLTGLAMSPAMGAAWPWLNELFAGRQSARSIHFICASLIGLFIIVHVVMVVLAGPINEMRSMITGRYRLPDGPVEPQEPAHAD